MKQIISLTLSLLAFVWATVSCSSNENNGYQGKNYVQLSTTVDPSMTENSTEGITVNLMATSTVEKDVTIKLQLVNNDDGVLKLNSNIVTMKAGSKTAQVTISSNQKNLLNEQRTVVLKAAEFSDANMVAQGDLSITVRPNPALPVLTAEQIKLIDGYRAKYGINLNNILGTVNCKVEAKSPTDEVGVYTDAETKTFEGVTVITLSEASTADTPVLKMTDNPLGLTAFLGNWLHKETDENEFWQHVSTAYPHMFKAIGFDKAKETFTATLDGIAINLKDKTISFTSKIKDKYDEDITTVPFSFTYTAWDRWKKMSDEGKSIKTPNGTDESGNVNAWTTQTVKELIGNGITLMPGYFLFKSTIDKDDWGETPSNWVAPKGTIDFGNGNMIYRFALDHETASGYTQFTVTYTFNH